MHNREIEVFLIGSTCLEFSGAKDWLHQLGVRDDYVEEMWDTSESLIALAAKRCYMSFEAGLNPNVTKVRDGLAAYLDNILASGHGSVLEHASFTFAIEGVTRVFTGEMNRHRAGFAISEGSMRFIRFDDIPWWSPPSIECVEEDSPDTKHTKALTHKLFVEVFSFIQDKYKELCKLWDIDNPELSFQRKKELTSMFRRIIPMGTCTGGVWTGNIRALRHMLTMRCSPAAEEEIRLVAEMMLAICQQEAPLLFGDFKQDKKGNWAPKYVKV